MFAPRYFAPRYWPGRFFAPAGVTTSSAIAFNTAKLASHIDLPRIADQSAFGRWANDLITRLQRAFETIIYVVNSQSITDLRANRPTDNLLNGNFYTATDTGITYIAVGGSWYPLGSAPGNVQTVASSPYAVQAADSTILVNAVSGTIVVQLPPATNAQDRIWVVKKIDASGNTVDLTPDGSDTIDGASTYSLVTQYDVVHVVSNGTAWFTI